MLVYIFWHWPRPDVALDMYEERQRVFHQALAAQAPAGLMASRVWRVTGAPWAGVVGAYEDWYSLADSAALDTLNAAAVSAALREAHDAAASLAAGGVAALYTPVGPREGHAAVSHGAVAQWFAKPEGMRYGELYQRLAPRLPRLWQRMMTLGPSPEFLLLDANLAALPTDWRPLVTRRESVWPPEEEIEETSKETPTP